MLNTLGSHVPSTRRYARKWQESTVKCPSKAASLTKKRAPTAYQRDYKEEDVSHFRLRTLCVPTELVLSPEE